MTDYNNEEIFAEADPPPETPDPDDNVVPFDIPPVVVVESGFHPDTTPLDDKGDR